MQNIDSEIELFDRNLDVLQAFGVSLKMVIKRAGCTKESKKAARRLTDDSLNILAETKEHLQTLKDDYGQWTMGTTNRYTQDLIQQFVYLQQNLRRLERLGKQILQFARYSGGPAERRVAARKLAIDFLLKIIRVRHELDTIKQDYEEEKIEIENRATNINIPES